MFCPACGTSVAENVSFCPNCGANLATAGPARTPAPPAYAGPVQSIGGMNYAPWATRAIGGLIDGLIVFAAVIVLNIVLGGLLGGLAAGMSGIGGDRFTSPVCCLWMITLPLGTLLPGLYNKVYLVSQRGYSIGQGVVKVKTVDASGNLLPQGTALIRLLVQSAFGFVPFLPLLDILWPLWDDKRQTLHDKAVNSYVIMNG